MMKHEFKFQFGQAVRVLDYDSPRMEHYAVILRRWLEAYRGNEDPDELEEQYEIELTFNGNKQQCMFLVDDITEDPDGNYWKIGDNNMVVENKELTIGHAKNHWLKNRKDKNLAALKQFAKINNHGFPVDDEFSLQQGSPCEGNLDIYYAHQYVEDEEPVWEQWDQHEDYEVSKLTKTNILVGSVTINYEGEYYNDDSRGYITKGGKTLAMINHKSGKMSRKKTDDSTEFVVSYEYDYDKNKECNES